MGFLTPKAPAPLPPPPPPVPVPTVDTAAAAAEQQSEALRNRRGRASTILSGSDTQYRGGEANVQTATKALLGS